jgi:hypothetical protein
MQNPFTVENMTTALGNIMASKGANRTSSVLNATHKYIRFEPMTDDDVITLENRGYELSDVPYDQDIQFLGDWYHDPSLPLTNNISLYCCSNRRSAAGKN